MKMRFIALAALVACAISGDINNVNAYKANLRRNKGVNAKHSVHEQFKKFLSVHNKKYDDKLEYQKRLTIFKQNLDIIEKHNSEYKQGFHTHFFGIGPFADLTAQEFKTQAVGECFNAFNQTRAPAPGGVHEYDPTVTAPDSVDWTTKGKVTPVKNQGQCGSCWAFSTTGSIESRYAIAKGQLNSLSEQELVDCSSAEGNQGCNGGLMDNAFKFVVSNNGLCTESEYKYVARTERKCKKSDCSKIDDPIKSYKDVTKDDEDALQQAVAEGPVSVAIEADQASFQHYAGGVMSGRCGKRLDHGVLAVGYGTDGANKYWKVKNSWGASWGENGYIRLCRDCKKNFKAGQCGIAADPSYPVV